MPRLTKIYTKTGDDGTTGLGGGQRVAKDSLRIETFGTVDELNAQVGVAIASGLEASLTEELTRVQNELFHLGSDLCVLEADKATRPVPRIEEKHIRALETAMDRMTEALGPLTNFILPGGSLGAGHLHVARTVCRRAERLAVALAREEAIGEFVVKYLNRLSDALFVMSRWENRHRNVADVTWNSRL
jgi:cob(I)alamin adenosyltransferase